MMDENKHSRPNVETLIGDTWLVKEIIQSHRSGAGKILPTSLVVGNKIYNKEIKTIGNENLSTKDSIKSSVKKPGKV